MLLSLDCKKFQLSDTIVQIESVRQLLKTDNRSLAYPGYTLKTQSRLQPPPDEWGEQASSEFSFPSKPLGYDPLLVFEFAPWGARTYCTYCTAGLSISPGMDAHPPTELIVYSETQAPGLVDLLYQLSFKVDPTQFYKPNDIVSFDKEPPNLGISLGSSFGLLPAPERAEVVNFPNASIRPEDERYIMTRPGEDRTPVQFLRVVGLVDSDAERWNEIRKDIERTRAWQLF